jgi:hypothetical protein
MDWEKRQGKWGEDLKIPKEKAAFGLEFQRTYRAC